jgi:hypothetical protein
VPVDGSNGSYGVGAASIEDACATPIPHGQVKMVSQSTNTVLHSREGKVDGGLRLGGDSSPDH